MPCRVIFDTNTLISAAVLRGSIPRQAFDKALDECALLLSAPLLLELADVFGRAKFDRYVSETARMSFLVGFLKITELIEITEVIRACRDPKDDMLLELAVCGKADFLVTGDADLLELNPFRGIEILGPKNFVERAI